MWCVDVSRASPVRGEDDALAEEPGVLDGVAAVQGRVLSDSGP